MKESALSDNVGYQAVSIHFLNRILNSEPYFMSNFLRLLKTEDTVEHFRYQTSDEATRGPTQNNPSVATVFAITASPVATTVAMGGQLVDLYRKDSNFCTKFRRHSDAITYAIA